MTTTDQRESMLSETLHAIATEAGFAVVKTAGTAHWPSFLHHLACWLAREGGQDERSERARLAATAVELRTADDTEAWAITTRRIVAWQNRFIDLLEQLDAGEREAAASRLRRLVRDHSVGSTGAAARPAATTRQNLHLQAHGNLFAVGAGNLTVHVPPAPDPPGGPGHPDLFHPDTADRDRQAVHRVKRRFLRRADRERPAFGLATSPHAQGLFGRLVAQDAPTTIVCEGSAGMGKSTVVGEVVALAEDQGWPVLPFRMDETEADDRTAEAVGRRLGLPASPATLIARVASGAPALLVVDQLDAASSYSGRMPDVFEAVDEMLETLAEAPNVKIVLVARTVDVENDPRLTSLVRQEKTTERFRLGLLDDEAVHTVLEADGTSPQTLGGDTLELLRTPLHLAVFGKLSKNARTAPYQSLQGLYATYTEETRREVERSLPAQVWSDITGRLVDEMSRRETLTVPYPLLDRFARGDLAVLVSAGVLFRADNDRIGFFHETYFDYLFARSFVGSGHDLHDFLAASGQALFRRAQTRQVLEHLRNTDRAEFRRTVVRLLTSGLVRPHLHFVALSVLEDLDATSEDWAVLDPLAWGEGVTAERLRGLLGRPAWFDAADTGRWERWLADPRTVPLVFRQLEWCTERRPERVLELLEPYVDADDAWRQRIRDWVGKWPSPCSVDLVRRLIDRGDFDDDTDWRSGTGVRFWDLFEQLAQQDAASAVRILGSFLTRALRRTAAAGYSDPFDSGHLPTPGGSRVGALVSETAAAVPRTTLDHVLPFVISVVESSHAADPEAEIPQSRWTHPPSPFEPDISDALYAAAHDALRTLAEQEPSAVAEVMGVLAAGEGWALNFLACRTYARWNRPDEALMWLTAASERLRLGWLDSPYWASRELIAAATQRCRDETLVQLLRTLLGHYPEHERTLKHRGLFGRAQYVLLEAVDGRRRTPEATRRLEELKRRFPQNALREPRPVEADFVGPPIDSSAGNHMTDTQWLRALRKHVQEGIDWSSDRPRGGATELASLLETAARHRPQRFARLGCRFDGSIPPPAFAAVIDGVAGKVQPGHLMDLCTHARLLVGEYVGRTICRAILNRAADVANHPASISLLADCVDDPDPAAESARTESYRGKYYYGGDLLTAGMNSTRGAAALAVGALLRTTDAPVQALLPLLDQLVRDPITAVRVCTADAVTALLCLAPAEALEFSERLFTGAPVDIHGALTTQKLLTRALLHDTERFAPELIRALEGPEGAARHAGATWSVLAMQGRLLPRLPQGPAALTPAARRGAAEMAASDPANGAPLLRQMFHDGDAAVREAAARSMRAAASLPPEASEELVDSFLSSPALSEHPETLAVSLSQSTLRLPSWTLQACQALAAVSAEGSRTGQRGYALIQRYLIKTVLRLYRQGGPATRAQCLDIIDGLYRVNAHDLSTALHGER
ncbi:hypothetical protein [Kitasatospora purpeofusca]|uniref:hypothetical protein n=1 Tax=Kitasatospora purpeofusca TaxID=67352 RepID=UPI0036D42DD7